MKYYPFILPFYRPRGNILRYYDFVESSNIMISARLRRNTNGVTSGP